MTRPAEYRHVVRRHCARPGCSALAVATFTFDAREQTVWLDVPSDGSARAGELCERHVERLTPPRGWRVDDRRRGGIDLRLAPAAASSPLLARAFHNVGRDVGQNVGAR